MNGKPLERLLRALLLLLLTDVLVEPWLRTLTGLAWLGATKNLLCISILVLTVCLMARGGHWKSLNSTADFLLLVVIGLALLSAGADSVPPGVAAQGIYVYLRGVIVFYAVRSLNVDTAWCRWPAGICLMWAVVNAVIAVCQVVIGPPAYTSLGWTDLEMAHIHRAQGLFNHPNDLGHLLGLTVVGLFAWTTLPGAPIRRIWPVIAIVLVGLAASQSRESMMGVACGLIVIFRRVPIRRALIATSALVLVAAIPLVAVAGVRTEVARRAAGLGVAIGLRVPAPRPDPALPICGPPSPVYVGGGSSQCRNVQPDQEIRVVFARQAVDLWRVRPLLGYGPGTFGGNAAIQADPRWNLHPRLGPKGFDLHGFRGRTVDSFWLHLTVELGVLGLVTYLWWLWALCRPLLRARDPFGPAAVVFVVVAGFFSLLAEGPFVPVLLFGLLGLAWRVKLG